MGAFQTDSRFKFLWLLFLPLALQAQIPDIKIPHSIEQYFRLNRVGPDLVCVDLIEHPGLGRTIRIKIISRRSQTARDFAFAFAAGAAVANMAEPDIELLWVELEVRFKGSEISTAIAPARCTIDKIILQCETEVWWDKCVQFP